MVKTESVKIYLVRHCETEGNLNRIFQGGIDMPPSEKGLMQLDLLSIRFRNIHIDKLYSSPLGRAKKTAEAINRFHNLTIIEDAGLREISVGKMDGMKWDMVPVLYYEAAEKWNNAPHEFESPEGDTMKQVFERISASLNKIVAECKGGETLVIVSHGCALKNLNCYLKFGAIDRLSDVDIGMNTAVSLWEYDGEKFDNIYMNDASHLPEYSPNLGKRHDFDLSLGRSDNGNFGS